MTIRVQLVLSDEEDKIVGVYRIQHKKKNNEEAVKEIIKQYKLLSLYTEKNKTRCLSKMERNKGYTHRPGNLTTITT